jgi:hypothetical protein
VAVIAVAAWVAGPVAALGLSAALLLLVCFEAARLRSRIGTAIDQTTRAAAAAGERVTRR